MNKETILLQKALDYHSDFPAGKIQVLPTKKYQNQNYLSLAYSPGVAATCYKIHHCSEDVYNYTNKGNLVAVISNGTAVLGLGNIGPLASKPVMEGKALLFKVFAGIDVFDIEINETNTEKFIEIVKAIAPTFGGINLEDIKSPEAFEIEQQLQDSLNIPVMHDDQHGTAIISGAALINAVELVGKKMKNIKMVINGAGSAAISCARIYKKLGIKSEHIIMLDSQGVIKDTRINISPEKKEFITKTSINTLSEAIKDADVFIGLSIGNILTQEMLKSMNYHPIVFAMANPTPEINYNVAINTRSDIIMATGRSDFPNQVNNVLGFPYIFRGALDVHATQINDAMKLAAIYAIAALAKKNVTNKVKLAYNNQDLVFGKEYIIPKPFDHRLITDVSIAVAKAAIASQIAQKPIDNWELYKQQLLKRMMFVDQNFINHN